MARQSRPRASAPARSAPPPQTRGAHTAAAPASAFSSASPARAPAPPANVPHAPSASASHTETKQPGMLAQMAATAGSVAVGSTIGHGLSSMLFGGSGQAAAPEAAAQPQSAPMQQQQGGLSCETKAKDFTQCLEKADLQSCSWYLEQLKACQAAASPY